MPGSFGAMLSYGMEGGSCETPRHTDINFPTVAFSKLPSSGKSTPIVSGVILDLGLLGVVFHLMSTSLGGELWEAFLT